MPRVYKPGDQVGAYTIDREINRGLTAFSYEASDPQGRPVFLKQYRSPTVRVSWYREYLDYQRELQARVEDGACRNFCYKFLRSFEFDRCFFQSFEFLDRSNSMEELLDGIAAGTRQLSDDQRVIIAKVLVGGVHALHQSNLVHSDLKPANVMLIRDKSIVAGYRVRIIDMDFSLLADRPAPWHGDRGYFGTPGYLSPEHLRGEVPCAASDVFTMGLMLYELIGDGHPYRFDDERRYREAVLALGAAPPKLIRPLADRASAEQLRALIHSCLAPAAKDRPDAIAVNLALNDRDPGGGPTPQPPAAEPDRPLVMLEFDAEEGPDPARPPIEGRLRLCDGAGRERVFNVTTPVGRVLLRDFGPESRFADELQFRLEKTAVGWTVVPATGTANETILNGRRVEGPTPLCDGDTLGVGREGKGVVKLPLTARPG